jgi:hypothetical protein
VTSFFESEDKDLLILFGDMLNDKKTRVNMCRSTINNIRLETSDHRPQGMHKHVIFILRISSTKEDYGLSFGREWRQYTLDMLNGTGDTTISMKRLINSCIDDLILDSISNEMGHFFDSAIIESISIIQYHRD